MTTDCGALAPPPALFSLVIELHLVCLVADVAPHEESIVRGHAIDPPLSERRQVPGHPASSEVAWQPEEAASCSLPSCLCQQHGPCQGRNAPPAGERRVSLILTFVMNFR